MEGWDPQSVTEKDIVRIPRAELHLHLNGSIRATTLEDFRMRAASGSSPLEPRPVEGEGRRNGGQQMEECTTTILTHGVKDLDGAFTVFSEIHRLVRTLEQVERIAHECIEDSVADGVVYLELRTTPKVLNVNSSKHEYVSAVLKGLRKGVAAAERKEALQTEDMGSALLRTPPGHGMGDGTGKITVRLLLSIDRRENEANARETVSLAATLKDEGVVGVDLSGNPHVGKFRFWRDALVAAREAGLKLSLHCGEVANPAEVEMILGMQPERLGHCTTVARNPCLMEMLASYDPCVEICLTSNVITGGGVYHDHHFRDFFAKSIPVVLCTDDSGVFSTTLSQEYVAAIKAFNLTYNQVVMLARNSIANAFCERSVKQILIKRLLQETLNHCINNTKVEEGILSSEVASEVALSCFARLPVPGKVKTRLAKGLGERPAACIYDAMAVHIMREIQVSNVGFKRYVFCSEESERVEFESWLTKKNDIRDVTVAEQEQSPDLGLRMKAALEFMMMQGHNFVILTGTDIPDLQRNILLAAVTTLYHGKCDVVLGPSWDGGYYLIGLRHTVPSTLFEHIQWSTERVLESTAARAATAGLVVDTTSLPILRDIDTVNDVNCWLESSNQSHPLHQRIKSIISCSSEWD